ncbi:hypothetical protein [Sphingomonas sp.]|jgi:hypothetical protein|uniref:hypothetical protein n=1 Tax=Sphingomonas sp. TaxID=28214 RepID=UPI002624D8E1|nr:hypothetical protein [Sphingomonas sp.]MDF2493889.1 hypothetical protein [Sphingomonas sp.]
MTQRATREDLLTILGLLIAGLVIGIILAWAMSLLGMGLDFVGLTGKRARGAYLREHPWEAGATIGSMLGVVLAGSAVLELRKKIGWRGMVPSWIWPSTQKVETTVAVRLGRVLHWISVGIASTALVLAVVIWFDQTSRVPVAEREHAAWEARHPVGPDGYRTGRDTYGADPEPYIPTVDYGTAAGITVFAALCALFGRGLRYIIAGE